MTYVSTFLPSEFGTELLKTGHVLIATHSQVMEFLLCGIRRWQILAYLEGASKDINNKRLPWILINIDMTGLPPQYINVVFTKFQSKDEAKLTAA